MATINAVGNGLSGATGTGSFVGSDSPVFTGNLTTPKLVISTSTQGILGETSGTAKSSGYVGEIIQSNILQSAAITLSSYTNVTSISVTAGQWLIRGNVTFGLNLTNIPSAYAWISTTSATLPDASLYVKCQVIPTAKIQGLVCNTLFLNVSTTTTVYLSAYDNGAGALACGNICALRVG